MSRGLYRDVLSYMGQELRFQNVFSAPEKLNNSSTEAAAGHVGSLWVQESRGLVRQEQHRHCQEPAKAPVLGEGLLQLYQELSKRIQGQVRGIVLFILDLRLAQMPKKIYLFFHAMGRITFSSF